MKEAIKLAKKAYDNGEIPVGAVIVKNGEIIGRGKNSKEKTNDITGHAEINAIKEAAKNMNTWKLDDCEIYVTLEPCLMCFGAIKDSRINKIYCSVKQNKKIGYTYYIDDQIIDIEYGTYEKESLELLQLFFEKLRR